MGIWSFLNGGFEMEGMVCQICGRRFWGRPDAKYDTKFCRRKAEMNAKIRKQEERKKAFYASLSPEERAFRESAPPWQLWRGNRRY
jgi:hypothetical protein